MPFNIQTRNRLARFVTDARELIASEFAEQLQSVYGLSSSGDVAPLSDLKDLDEERRSIAELLRDRVGYIKESSAGKKNAAVSAIERLAREQAFTVLNRLAALRMAEKRGFIIESVGRGYQSKGFQVYSQVVGNGLGGTYHRYRTYLYCLFDELALDLGILFDRRSPASLLFPREPALGALFQLLNAPEIDPLWGEDETIGWIYQYYNDEAERKRMREESGTPRNSRELAVRNQFFTPRYVVEFLTDNTLGRIWYEMTRGETSLTNRCHYFVRRPNEKFLNPGQTPPRAPETATLTHVEILNLPVYIPHRPMKDPRELRLLDPACGSMHFGLYAFDILEVIYEESWDASQKSHVVPTPPLTPLWDTYASKAVFLRDVPKLIIEHNIHGIDIDPRAVQIAALSLWLRAQKAWQEQHVPIQERPKITRSHVVCAEPMPGNATLLNDFTGALKPPVLGQLVTEIFKKMTLAGEAGSLLKIEVEIARLLKEAKRQWVQAPKAEQDVLFPEAKRPTQETLRFERTGITDEQFWDTVEQLIYNSLRDYAEKVDTGYVNRLFAEDSARGFAFIDLCRKRYDVIVMNPPFGEPSEVSQPYLREEYSDDRNEIMACFLTRSQGLADGSAVLGVISSRTVFFNTFCESARKRFFFGISRVSSLIDLGWRVLDGAAVEAAAYCAHVGNVISPPIAIRALRDNDRAASILRRIAALAIGEKWPEEVFSTDLASLEALPHSPLAYWMSSSFLAACRQHHSLAQDDIHASVGLSSADNFRYLRLAWEVDPARVGPVGSQQTWVPLVKGGEYNPMYDDVHLLLNWDKDGYELLNSSTATIRNAQYYGMPGLTYPYRTASGFCLRILPTGCAFSDGGQGLITNALSGRRILQLAAYCHTRVPRAVLEVFLGEGGATSAEGAARNYVPRAIEEIPLPSDLDVVPSDLALEWAMHMRRPFLHDETAREFCCPPTTLRSMGVQEATKHEARRDEKRAAHILTELGKADGAVTQDFGVTDTDMEFLAEEFGELVSGFSQEIELNRPKVVELYQAEKDELTRTAMETVGARRFTAKKMYWVSRRIELMSRIFSVHPTSIVSVLAEEDPVNPQDLKETALSLVSWILGAAFGRWDTQYLAGQKPLAAFTDAFAALPPCPPGMLRNDRGLPMTKEDLSRQELSDERLRSEEIPWNGILSDDSGHKFDINERVERVLERMWPQRAESVQQELCEILGVNSFQEYFRRPSGFFADHLMRYSKSRRQSPIYWPLSTRSCSYTLWVYYPRLTTQTLHACLADFLDPKLKSVSSESASIRNGSGSQIRLGELLDFEDELKEMRAEIDRVIKLPYVPDLDDGVVITASPLWSLFRFPKWQKDLKLCWKDLERGDYDWAHLAYSVWPARTREKCKHDRSIAIAHALEDLCAAEKPKPKSKKEPDKQTSLNEAGGRR